MKVRNKIEDELNLPVIMDAIDVVKFSKENFTEGTLQDDYANSRNILKKILSVSEKILQTLFEKGFELNARNMDSLSNLLLVMNKTSVNVLTLSEKIVSIYKAAQDDKITGNVLLDENNQAILVGTLAEALKLANKKNEKELKNGNKE